MAKLIARGLFLGLLVTLLTSCVFQRDSPFVDDAGNPIVSPPIPQDSSKAVVFFYRPGRLGRAGVSAPVVISGKSELLVGRLPNSAYTWVTVPPGKYEFKTWFHSMVGEEKPSTTLPVEGGQRYYIRILVGRFDSEIASVAGPEAEKEIKETQYIRPTQNHFAE